MDIVDPRVPPDCVPAGSRALVIAEHQDEYRNLPSIRTPGGQVITRWALTDEERSAVFEGADLYITILSAGAINPLFATIGPIDWRSSEPQGVPGATGRFPRGQLDPTDEGELQIAMAADIKAGIVRLRFGKLISWLGFPPALARALAAGLLEKADELEQHSTKG
jgi:hypothetical protein